jgi:hypothetical protein
MELQAHTELTKAADKLLKVRDAKTHGELEQAIVIDVYATLRTVLAMYTDPGDPNPIPPATEAPTGRWLKDIKTAIRGE